MLDIKIETATFDALSDDVKKEYKKVGDMYQLDIRGIESHPDVVALKTAKDAEVTKSKGLDKDLKALKTENATLKTQVEKGANSEEALTALRAEYDGKLKTADDDLKAAKKEHADYRNENTIGAEATRLANKLLKDDVPDFTKNSFIDSLKKRMSLDEGSDIIRIMNTDGTPSAKNSNDLEKEMLDNKDYAGILAGSKASGSTKTISEPGNKKPNTENKSLLEMSPEDLLAATDGGDFT